MELGLDPSWITERDVWRGGRLIYFERISLNCYDLWYYDKENDH